MTRILAWIGARCSSWQPNSKASDLARQNAPIPACPDAKYIKLGLPPVSWNSVQALFLGSRKRYARARSDDGPQLMPSRSGILLSVPATRFHRTCAEHNALNTADPPEFDSATSLDRVFRSLNSPRRERRSPAGPAATLTTRPVSSFSPTLWESRRVAVSRRRLGI